MSQKDLRRYYIKEMFSNFEKVKLTGIWLNGFRGEGQFKSWHKNGQLMIHSFHKEGKKEGEYKHWYSGGQLFERCYYKNDKYDGEYKMWHENGKLISHSFCKNGVIVRKIK